MKRIILLVAWLFPSITLAAEAAAGATKPSIYRVIDTGFFVILAIAVYILGIVVGRQTMKTLGAGTIHKLLNWLTWGLVLGVVFQSYIFIFDFKKVAGLTPAQIGVGWHVFFTIAILLMVIGIIQTLKRIKNPQV